MAEGVGMGDGEIVSLYDWLYLGGIVLFLGAIFASVMWENREI